MLQGPFIQPGPSIPKSPYSVPVVPLHESGLCEVIIVLLVLLLWLYSFYRLYLVWQKTLNFSEASIQGPQGWDLLVNWVIERIQVRTETNEQQRMHFERYIDLLGMFLSFVYNSIMNFMYLLLTY